MVKNADISQLVARLIELRREDWRLRYDDEIEEELSAPCSTSALTSLERLFGAALPPSYRAFLELHDGWGGFRGDSKILALGDRQEAWVKEALANLSDLFDELGDSNPVKSMAFVIMVGETSNWSLFFDASKVSPDGEMEVVLFDWTRLEQRYSGFGAFLAEEVERERRVIRIQKVGLPVGDDNGALDDEPK